MVGGPIAMAAKRVADHCLPHFEHEEKIVFPALALLPYLKPGNLRPEMKDVMSLISDFNAKRDALVDDHQAILAAIDALLHAAYQKKDREFTEFAYDLRFHEQIEDEVIYPSILLIGN